MKTLPILVLLMISLIAPPDLLSQDKQLGPRAIGAGAFPVTFTHASAWFGNEASAARKRLVLMVYFEGRAGWHNAKTDFKWQVNQTPATIDMAVGDVPIHVKYSSDSQQVVIQGQSLSLRDGNVFLVEGTDIPVPKVQSLGTHDLTFAPTDNPAVVLLQRNPQVWAALARRPISEHSANAPQPNPALAALDKEGLALILKEDPDSQRKGCELLRQAAIKGYAHSQYRFGYCYESGQGMEQNFATANEWYEKAAKQGHVDAQYKLAHSYRVGRGMEVDLNAALHWYREAAANGDVDAMHNLGWMYGTGQGVGVSATEAFQWFLRAAEQGETNAQCELVRRLREGDGTSKDLVRAYGWLRVLETNKDAFSPDDWRQIAAVKQEVEGSLDDASKNRANELSRQSLAVISKNELLALARRRD